VRHQSRARNEIVGANERHYNSGMSNDHPSRSLLVITLAAAGLGAGCDSGKTEGTSASASAATPTATSASAAPSATTDAKPNDPLASLFVNPKPEGFAFVKIGAVKGHAITMRAVTNWGVEDTGDDMLWLNSKHGHSKIWVSVVSKGHAYNDNELRLKCQRVGASGCTWGEPVEGMIGDPPMKGQIRKGSAKMFGKPAEVYWLRAAYTDKLDVVVFSSIRKDVYPKREPEMINSMRTLAINLDR
jgi:hypothetical protein